MPLSDWQSKSWKGQELEENPQAGVIGGRENGARDRWESGRTEKGARTAAVSGAQAEGRLPFADLEPCGGCLTVQ